MKKTITVNTTSYIEVDICEDDLGYIEHAVAEGGLSFSSFNEATGLDLDDTDIIDNADDAEVVEIE